MEMDLSLKDSFIKGSPDLLQQAWLNLLDNAIEASQKEDNSELRIRIAAERGYHTIRVKNRITASVLAENPELISSKNEKDLHGFGIPQIKEIVDSYNGMYDFYEEDGFFCVGVFIPQ